MIAREDTPGRKYLAAYLVPANGTAAPDPNDLHNHLANATPDPTDLGNHSTDGIPDPAELRATWPQPLEDPRRPTPPDLMHPATPCRTPPT